MLKSHHMLHRRYMALSLVAAFLLALPGCSGVQSALGLSKDPPDEFRVMVRAPLAMPQDFGLMAPRPGEARPQELAVRDRARQIVLEAEGGNDEGRTAPVMISGVSDAEAALLRKFGSDQVDDNIRREIDRESAQLAVGERTLLDSIIFWKSPEATPTVVDPQQEAQRIRESAALGQRATDTPSITIERKQSRSLFSRIF